MTPADQLNLFESQSAPTANSERRATRMRVMVTVTAAPNPSATHGETVCVAGIRIDVGSEGWVRLYPVNLRHFGPERFHKYDVLDLHATPQRKHDQRLESWAPASSTIEVVGPVTGWPRRMNHLRSFIETDMCALTEAARSNAAAPSLALIRPTDILDLVVEPHPGWTRDEQLKIDSYANQLDLFGEERRPLEAPRFKSWYRYRCSNTQCKTHRQGLIDWEFVVHQRRLLDRPDPEAVGAIRQRWLDEICSSRNDTCFYVGNQAKRRHVFSILGVTYGRR